MTRPERDAQGKPTGKTRARPTFDVMTTSEAVIANPTLQQFVVTHTYIDEVWAGDDPTNLTQTVYLRFNSQAEYQARVGKYLDGNAS